MSWGDRDFIANLFGWQPRQKYNENHDPDDGRFTFANGGSSSNIEAASEFEILDPASSRGILSWDKDKAAIAVYNQGLPKPKTTNDYSGEEIEGYSGRWSQEIREETKREVATSLADNWKYEGMGSASRYDYANERVSDWAQSSGDDNPSSLATQYAASIVFEADANPYMQERWQRYMRGDSPKFASSEIAKRQGLLRAMYANTQAQFKAAGITHVTLYRGVGDSAKSVKVGAIAEMNSNPLESWTTSPGVAADFGWHILKARIPVSRILSTPRTGFGCLNEHEFVVIMKKGDKVRKVK